MRHLVCDKLKRSRARAWMHTFSQMIPEATADKLNPYFSQDIIDSFIVDDYIDEEEDDDTNSTTSSCSISSAFSTMTSLKRASSCPALKKKNMTTCSYRGGRCLKPCALKANGTKHSLCELHRKRQNDNQKKSDARRRQEITHRRRTRRLGYDRNVLEPFKYASTPDVLASLRQEEPQVLEFLRSANFGESYREI